MEEPPCVICRSWPKNKRFDENDLFEMVPVTSEDTTLMEWISAYYNINHIDAASTDNILFAICEVHFLKEDYVREYNDDGPILKLVNDSVIPTFGNYEECVVNNQIGSFTDFLLDYHKCLNTQPNWDMLASENEVTFMLKLYDVVIRVKSSMLVIVQDGSSTFEQGSILESHLNNGYVEHWSKMRALMLFCEENSPLTEVMVRLGATVVLAENDEDMFSSLDDVLCYVKTILDDSWLYEICTSTNNIVGFQLETRGTPKICKSIKVYSDFSMTGYLDNEIIATKNPGTIRFLQIMDKERGTLSSIDENDDNDGPNWDVAAVVKDDPDQVQNFEALIQNLSENLTLPPDWQVIVLENCLLLYKADMTGAPKLKCAIKVTKNLKCTGYVNGSEIDMNSIISSFNYSVLTFNMFEAIAEALNNIEQQNNVVLADEMEEGEIAPESHTTQSDSYKRLHEELILPDEEPFKRACLDIQTDGDSDFEIISDSAAPVNEPPPLVFYGNNETPNSTNLTCPECGEEKANQNALTRHLLKHKTEFVCQLCSEVFASPKDLRLHMDSKHTIKIQYNCPHCDDNFFVEGELKTHIERIHHRTLSSYHRCKLCLMTFRFKKHLTRHSKEFHKKPEVEQFIEAKLEYKTFSFTCKICQGKTSFHKHMMKHVEKHLDRFKNGEVLSKEEQIVLNQPVIEESSESITELEDDGVEEEEEEGEIILGGNTEPEYSYGEILYEDDIQEETNKTNTTTETRNETEKHPCKLCPYVAARSNTLQRHMLYHDSPHRCSICSRCFPKSSLLRRHEHTHVAGHIGENDQDSNEDKNGFSKVDATIEIDDSNDAIIKEEDVE